MRPFKGNIDVFERGEQTTPQIIRRVIEAHQEGLTDYKEWALRFNSISPVESARRVFQFCKAHIKYKVERDTQSTRSLAAILRMAEGDCKHYSQLIAGVMATLAALNNWDCKLYFRFASYDHSTTPKHVFVVLKFRGAEYWIDPVLNTFNQRYPAPTYFTDKKISVMPLVHISGVEAQQNENLFTVVREFSGSRGVGVIAPLAEDQIQPVTYPTVNPGSPSTFDPLSSPTNVQYLVTGDVPLKFPMQNPDGAIPPFCPQDLKVVYPTTWGGENVPSNLPRPFSVGNRILLIPKNVHQDVYKINNWKWLIFMVRVMQPLVNAYSIQPSKNWQFLPGKTGLANTLLADAIFWDSDLSDPIDYVGLMPTVIPVSSTLIPEVKYLVTETDDANGQPIWKELKFPDRYPGEAPHKLPRRIWVEYPTHFKGVPLPKNLPYPYINQDNGLLQLWPKGITDVEMKANYFFWLSFVTSVMAPFIRTYAPVDYSATGNILSDQILYDCDSNDIIQNYLAMPKGKEGFLSEIAERWKSVIDFIGRGFVAISMLLPRQAFMLLCRLNFCGWGRKFHQGFKYDLDFFNKTKERWEKLGGNFTNLVDACENGREKIDLSPDNPNDMAVTDAAGIGEPITVGAAAVIGASCIAAMAPILKMFTDDKTDAVIDAAAGAANIVLTATGNDPVNLGSLTGKPVVITDPLTGEEITLPPATQSPFQDFLNRNKIVIGVGAVAAIGAALIYMQQKRSRKKLF